MARRGRQRGPRGMNTGGNGPIRQRMANQGMAQALFLRPPLRWYGDEIGLAIREGGPFDVNKDDELDMLVLPPLQVSSPLSVDVAALVKMAQETGALSAAPAGSAAAGRVDGYRFIQRSLTIGPTDSLVEIDATDGDVDATLGRGFRRGQQIACVRRDASENTARVVATIKGAPNVELAPGDALTLFWNGAEFRILSHYTEV